MRINKHAFKCVVSLLMTLVLVFGMVVATSAFDADLADAKADSDVASTGISGTVYFKNTANWSSVNAYVWVHGTTTSVQAWPGAAMTLDEGNVYKYTVSGDYNMIIFSNNGANQTADLSIPAAGQIYDFSTGTWSPYKDEPTTDDPTQAPTQMPTQSGETKMVYCKNSAGWGSVNVYMWSDSGTSKNAEWPGAKMTHVGEDVWQYEVTGDWDKIIFNNGSGTQTGDLSFPGNGRIYDNSTNSWDVFDTSPITVKKVGTDLEAPQYKGTDITLTADAVSTGGDVAYKFSVTFGGATTVLSDYTTINTATWTPTAAGTYTITYDFMDTAGNKNQRTATYEVKDDSGIADPILKGVSPKPGQIKKGTAVALKANAAGGQTGTNLLFYKFTVKDANGIVVNVPYYTKNAQYNFTPSSLGTYTVTVSVQNCDNELIERTFTYTSVNEIDDNPIIPTIPTDTPTSSGGYLKGDADDNGDVNIMDATAIQLNLAKMDVTINEENADVDSNSEVNIMDATVIQLYLAQLYPDW
ncbi:MAG: starch-binding protein [Ruminococcus sp.]|nr:starch-binding protein [Ruminococcus sp.]